MVDEIEPAKVLLVEDKQTIAATLQKIFTLAGYDCRSFVSAEEFLKQEDCVWTPDFALIDVILPGINGLELAVCLRHSDQDLKVALFSGHTETNRIVERAEGMGHHFDVFAKPVHPSVLLEFADKSVPKATRGCL